MKNALLISSMILGFSLGAQADFTCGIISKNFEHTAVGTLAVQYEHGSPIGEGSVNIEGLQISFESGWSGVSEASGGKNKEVFNALSVSRGNQVLGTSVINGEHADKFEISLKGDSQARLVYCQEK